MRILGKTLYGIFIALLIAVAGLFVVSLLPIPGNIEIKIVKSGSMEPSIMTGAIVVVKPVESYKVGDVVMFGKDTKAEIPTTHRIVSVSEDTGVKTFMTKGDANEEADPQTVPTNEVIGKVIFSAPYVGYVLDFARKPLGFTFLVGVPALMIILDELWKIFDEVRRIRREKKKGKGAILLSDDEGGDEDDGDGDENGVKSATPLSLRQKTPKNESSASATDNFTSHKHVLPQQLALVDGIVPTSVITDYYGVQLVVTKKVNHTVYFSPKTFIVALMSLSSLFGLLSVGVGGTVSYFNDTERSIGNIFRAGGVDLRLSATQDVAGRFAALAVSEPLADEKYPEEIQVGSETFLLTVGESDGSEPLVYSIETVLEGGAGCEVLELEASQGDYVYDGLFKDFSLETTDEMGDWTFTVYIPEGAEGIAPDAVCSGELVFRAYSKDKEGGVLSRIFMDEEEYYFTIKNYPLISPDPLLENIIAPEGQVEGESTTTEGIVLPEDNTGGSSSGSGEPTPPLPEATTTEDTIPPTEEGTDEQTEEPAPPEEPIEETVPPEEEPIEEIIPPEDTGEEVAPPTDSEGNDPESPASIPDEQPNEETDSISSPQDEPSSEPAAEQP